MRLSTRVALLIVVITAVFTAVTITTTPASATLYYGPYCSLRAIDPTMGSDYATYTAHAVISCGVTTTLHFRICIVQVGLVSTCEWRDKKFPAGVHDYIVGPHQTRDTNYYCAQTRGFKSSVTLYTYPPDVSANEICWG